MKTRQIVLFAASALLTLAIGASSCTKSASGNPEMDRFVSSLMGRMTLEEKIGQLNLPVAGTITTGEGVSLNVEDRIKNGEVGGLFNVKGAAEIRRFQQIAVDSS
ncbi:MAG: beta-glucosidase, partial [Bacteroidales bacterium]|nr:beta-glucosidase [Bacteroidales bacterium]